MKASPAGLKWREFRSEKAGRVQTWSIGQEGDTYWIRHGKLDGKMQETSDAPGPKGKEGSKSFMDAVANCTFNVDRQIRHRAEKGFTEYVDGQPLAALSKVSFSVDFSKPMSKSFCCYKPTSEKHFTVEAHEELYKSGRARYTLKRDGECHLAVNHGGDLGWRIYSRRMDDVTEKFEHVVMDLIYAMIPEGTLLTGEMTITKKGQDDPILMASYARSKPERAKVLLGGGVLSLPTFNVYDMIFFDGKSLQDKTYDERMKLLKDELKPLFLSSENVKPIEFVLNVGPKNWERVARKARIEGFVVVDGACVPGDKFFTFDGKAARPKGHWKLKPASTEDCVAFAACRGSGSNRETVGSLMLKQRSHSGGGWFDCGKAGSGITEDGGELDREKIAQLCKESGIPMVDDDYKYVSELVKASKGFVVEVEYQARQPSGKFKFPVIKHIRHDKKPDECFANM